MKDPASTPVMRGEFVRAWNGMLETARHVDDLKKAFSVMLHRLEQLDRQVGEMSKKMDDLDPTKVNA